MEREQAAQMVLGVLRSLEWVVNVAKSHLTLSQNLIYLGAWFETAQRLVFSARGAQSKDPRAHLEVSQAVGVGLSPGAGLDGSDPGWWARAHLRLCREC